MHLCICRPKIALFTPYSTIVCNVRNHWIIKINLDFHFIQMAILFYQALLMQRFPYRF